MSIEKYAASHPTPAECYICRINCERQGILKILIETEDAINTKRPLIRVIRIICENPRFRQPYTLRPPCAAKASEMRQVYRSNRFSIMTHYYFIFFEHEDLSYPFIMFIYFLLLCLKVFDLG